MSRRGRERRRQQMENTTCIQSGTVLSPSSSYEWATRSTRRPSPTLRFSPAAWVKLMWFCHNAKGEISGFGITRVDDPLYVEEFRTIEQRGSSAHTEFEDEGVAKYQTECLDQGIEPVNFMRVWIHTHPNISAHPSITDENTFDRVFGKCDFAVMFIVSRTGEKTCRLKVTGFKGQLTMSQEIPIEVVWSALSNPDVNAQLLGEEVETEWTEEYVTNIKEEVVWTPGPLNKSTLNYPRNYDSSYPYEPIDYRQAPLGSDEDYYDSLQHYYANLGKGDLQVTNENRKHLEEIRNDSQK